MKTDVFGQPLNQHTFGVVCRAGRTTASLVDLPRGYVPRELRFGEQDSRGAILTHVLCEGQLVRYRKREGKGLVHVSIGNDFAVSRLMALWFGGGRRKVDFEVTVSEVTTYECVPLEVVRASPSERALASELGLELSELGRMLDDCSCRNWVDRQRLVDVALRFVLGGMAEVTFEGLCGTADKQGLEPDVFVAANVVFAAAHWIDKQQKRTT